MERLIAARHGESAFSARGLLNGDPSVHVPLTERGVAQARALGRALAVEPLDLCVISAFERTAATAREALAGRELPQLVLPDLGDPRYGVFEGVSLEAYRDWAASASSTEAPPGGGESRADLVARYTEAFATLLARPERSILVVAHSLPIAYLLGAASGDLPARRTAIVDYATAHALPRPGVERAVAGLEGWLAAPPW